MSKTIELTVVAATDDGSSHFTSVEVAMTAGAIPADAPPYFVTDVVPTSRFVFSEFPAGFEMTWHPAPREQVIVVLSGHLEVETGDGEVRSFGPGDNFLVTDTTGRGHCSRVPGPAPCRFTSIALAEPLTIPPAS